MKRCRQEVCLRWIRGFVVSHKMLNRYPRLLQCGALFLRWSTSAKLSPILLAKCQGHLGKDGQCLAKFMRIGISVLADNDHGAIASLVQLKHPSYLDKLIASSQAQRTTRATLYLFRLIFELVRQNHKQEQLRFEGEKKWNHWRG